jgi:hypothetical protein
MVPASSVKSMFINEKHMKVYVYMYVRQYFQYTARMSAISYIYGRLCLIRKFISLLSFSFQFVLEVQVLGVFSVLYFVSKDLWCRHE